MRSEFVLGIKVAIFHSSVGVFKWLKGRILHLMKIDLSWISVNSPQFIDLITKEPKSRGVSGFVEISNTTLHVASGHVFVDDSRISNFPKLIRESSYWEPIHAQFSHGLVPRVVPKLTTTRSSCFPISNPKNYFHWLMDELPYLLQSSVYRSQIEYIHSGALEDYQLESLDLLKIESRNVYPWVNANKVLVPAARKLTGEYSVKNIMLLREMLTILPQAISHPTKELIYISRRNSRRALKNESDLEKFLLRQGYQILYLENMRLIDQIRAFANAKRIVGPHGAGLANIVFCKPHVQIVEILNSKLSNPCFQDLSKAAQLKYKYVNYDDIETNRKFSMVL